MALTAAGAKYCCKCGADVTSAQRMKDSTGHYWCVTCGQKDKDEKAAATGALCASCGENFSMSHLTRLRGVLTCDKCLKKNYKKAGTGLSSLFKLFKR